MQPASEQPRITPFLYSTAVAVALLLLARNMGLYPHVFADEYTYSKFARLLPFDQANLPNYLYFWIFRTTLACGDGFLTCARILNVTFFVSAAPFIYLISRRVAGAPTALLISTLSILGPVGSYTAYFMPESLFFFSFWLFTYLALEIRREQAVGWWILLGVVFGISALIKPHALFLLPPLLVYLFVVQRRVGKAETGRFSFSRYSSFFAAAFLTKWGVGFALAGISGVTLFGGVYTSIASGSIKRLDHYVDLVALALENSLGHLLSLSLLFPVALASLLLASTSFFRRGSPQRDAGNITLYTALVLGCLLGIAAVFTASVAGSSPGESNSRLHMRYYNFAFPLLLVVAAIRLGPSSDGSSILSRALAALPPAAAICYAAYTQMAPYTTSYIDNPELRGFTVHTKTFYVLAMASFCSLALWVYSARLGARTFLYLFMPLAVISSSLYVNQEMRVRLIPDVFDKAGVVARQYLSKEDAAKTLVVGSQAAGLFKTLFHLDNPQASIEIIPEGADYDLSRLPAGKEWALIVGDHSLQGDAFFQLPMNGFTLARSSGPMNLDFTKPNWPGMVSSAHGLSSPEGWGTWSAGDMVTFHFPGPLPEKFKLTLVASAFGPNAGKQVIARVGNSSGGFTLGNQPEERIMHLDNPEGSKILTIDIPLPVSPKELGVGDDERRLGIGFVEMAISPD